MKISYNWLSSFIKTQYEPQKLADILTDIGLEVEGLEQTGISANDLEGFVVGRVMHCEKHPNADKLSLTQVNLGKETVQIVCGAPNVAEGQLVPVATVGAEIKTEKGESFKIKKAKLRGEVSNGMICSKKELRLGEDHAGIWAMEGEFEPGTPVSEAIEIENDYVFEIGLTPNRADAMSHFGVARDLYAALKSRKFDSEWVPLNPLSEIEIPIQKENSDDNLVKIQIEEEKLCPRFAGCYLKNIEIKPSPEWIQNHLKSIGLSPINNVVDITNYILHGLGQPMHAYDADKISGNTIVVKKSKKDSIFSTLDGVERKLNGEELMICDSEKPIGIAGVMGGMGSSINNKTQNVYLECAYFDPVSVRKTSKYHTINSDASFRFERGIDPNITLTALHWAIELLMENANAEVVGEITDIYPKPIQNFNVPLRNYRLTQLIGERIHREKIKEILELLDIEILSEANETLDLMVPAYRVDVQREVDVIEEILRIYGYNTIQIPSKVTASVAKGEGFFEKKVENTLSQILVSHGFYEAMNISMYKPKYDEWLGVNDKESVPLLNSLSNDLSVMRRSMLPGLLESLAFNINRKNSDIKLFEWGKTYTRKGDGFSEKRTLALIVSGAKHKEYWGEKPTDSDFNYLKGILAQLFRRSKINSTKIISHKNSAFSNAIDYTLNGETLATLGIVDEKLSDKFGVNQTAIYAEINEALLLESYRSVPKTQYQPSPKYPSVRRDLALLLDSEIGYQEIEETVLKTEPKYIKKVNLFDVYEGKNLPKGKKSYAISLVLQDEEKTMNDQQIDQILQKIITQLNQSLAVELRS